MGILVKLQFGCWYTDVTTKLFFSPLQLIQDQDQDLDQDIGPLRRDTPELFWTGSALIRPGVFIFNVAVKLVINLTWADYRLHHVVVVYPFYNFAGTYKLSINILAAVTVHDILHIN